MFAQYAQCLFTVGTRRRRRRRWGIILHLHPLKSPCYSIYPTKNRDKPTNTNHRTFALIITSYNKFYEISRFSAPQKKRRHRSDRNFTIPLLLQISPRYLRPWVIVVIFSWLSFSRVKFRFFFLPTENRPSARARFLRNDEKRRASALTLPRSTSTGLW